MGMMDRLRSVMGSEKEEVFQTPAESRNVATRETEAVWSSDYDRIRSLVGVPESRRYELQETQGQVNLYRHEATGSRINVGTNGEFYDGELRQIGANEASSYQRMTQEWRSHAYDKTAELTIHLERFAAPEMQRFTEEQKLVGMHQATPEQQMALAERLQSKTGLAYDSASLAVVAEVATQKGKRGIELSPEDQLTHEHYLDTLRGKDGSYYMKETREEDFARSKMAPALEKYALDNGVAVDKLSEEQVRHVGFQTGRMHQIPEGIATEQARFAHLLQERDIELRSIRLESAVGETHAERYIWRQTTADVESYQHNDTGRYVHIDREGKFYNQAAAHIDKADAIHHAESFLSVEQINAITSRALTEPSIDEQARSGGKGFHSIDELNAITNRILAENVEVQAPPMHQVEQSISM